jgi:hypothetical protein
VHAPFEHIWVSPQFLPQVPQFLGSFFVSRHAPPHGVIPPRHVHMPAEHVW